MKFQLMNLPYESKQALNPYISADTLDYHHGKHHQTYVNKLNDLIEGNASYQNMSLEEVVKNAANNNDMPVFNNAAQIWNHDFLWHSMSANGGGQPTGALMQQIEKSFGSFENFANEFRNAGISQFGSGWVWLVWNKNNNRLEISKTANAETPLTSANIPLLTADVWEHAYYLDYQNKRPDYLDAFLLHLINWDFASKNFNSIA